MQGPNINGKITVDNCALPGEMVRLRKNQISIEADESFSANGYYWRIGKRKQNEKGNWVFEDPTEWDINKKATGYDTYKQGVTDFVKEKDFTTITTAPASPLITWNDINIKIGEAIYGGGYSVAQGTSVMANDSTVLKFTRQYNIDKAFTERQEKLSDLPNGTTTGFGGNTTILVADNSATDSDRDHIIISHQKMQSVVLPTGTDLFGYYYMDKDGNYRYISLCVHDELR